MSANNVRRIRVARVILVVVLFCGYSIAQSNEKTIMLDSFGRISNGDLRGRTDVLLAQLALQGRSNGLVAFMGHRLRSRQGSSIFEITLISGGLINHASTSG